MRQEDRVRRIEQGLWNMRLVCKDVETGSGNRSVLQRFGKRVFIHHRTASDIDEHAFRSERLQHVRIDGLRRFRAARRNQNERVDGFGQFLKARMIFVSDIRRLAAIVFD